MTQISFECEGPQQHSGARYNRLPVQFHGIPKPVSLWFLASLCIGTSDHFMGSRIFGSLPYLDAFIPYQRE